MPDGSSAVGLESGLGRDAFESVLVNLSLDFLNLSRKVEGLAEFDRSDSDEIEDARVFATEAGWFMEGEGLYSG